MPKWCDQLTPYVGKQIVTAAGHFLTNHGWISVPVRLGNKTFTVTAVVADELPRYYTTQQNGFTILTRNACNQWC
jgi:hypothetical protein